MTCILESPPPLSYTCNFFISFPFFNIYIWKHGKIKGEKSHSGYLFITVRRGDSKQRGTKSSKKLYAFMFCIPLKKQGMSSGGNSLLLEDLSAGKLWPVVIFRCSNAILTASFSLFSSALIQSCYLSFTCWWPAKIHFPCLSLFMVKCESSGSFGYLKHRYCKHVAVGPLWSRSSSLGMALLSTPALAAQIQLQGICTDHSLMMRILLWLTNVILLEIRISWLLKKIKF